MSKMAIVGCDASGKTVLISSISDYYKAGSRPGQTSIMVPTDSPTRRYTDNLHRTMRIDREWPQATSDITGGTVLNWKLLRDGAEIADIELMDFGGENFRRAFRNDQSDSNVEIASKLRDYIAGADFVVVTVSMDKLTRNLTPAVYRQLELGDVEYDRDSEAQWVTGELLKMLSDRLTENPPGVMIALTQADKHASELERCGDAKSLFTRCWPQVASMYPNLKVVAVASVDRVDEEGRPAEGYRSDGVLTVMNEFEHYLKCGRRRHRPAKKTDGGIFGRWVMPFALLLLVAGAAAFGWYRYRCGVEELERRAADAERERQVAERERQAAAEAQAEKFEREQAEARRQAAAEAERLRTESLRKAEAEAEKLRQSMADERRKFEERRKLSEATMAKQQEELDRLMKELEAKVATKAPQPTNFKVQTTNDTAAAASAPSTPPIAATPPETTFERRQRLAEEGSVEDMIWLGNQYYSSSEEFKIEKDLKKAFEWYSQAADKGSNVGWYNLSLMAEQGEGCEKNEELSGRYCLKAAQLGHVEAMAWVGLYYLEGTHSFGKSPTDSLRFLNRAKSAGFAGEGLDLADCIRRAEAEQRARAKSAKSRKWFFGLF